MTQLAPIPSDYRVELQLDDQKLPAMLEDIRSLVVTTPEDLAIANALIHAVALKKKEREAKLKVATDHLNGAIKEIRSWFKPGLDFLTEARAVLEPKIGGYLQAQEAERQRALQAAQEAHSAGNHRETAEALNVAATAQAEVKGTTVRYRWRAVVINPAIVPYEYLAPDVAKIQAHAKASPGDGPEPPPIAGVRYEQELDMTIRTATR